MTEQRPLPERVLADNEQETQALELQAQKQKSRERRFPTEGYVNNTVHAFRDYLEGNISEDDMRGILLRREARDLQPLLIKKGLDPELAMPRNWYRSQWAREDNAALPEDQRLTPEQLEEKHRRHEELIIHNMREGTMPPIPYFESEEYRAHKEEQQLTIQQQQEHDAARLAFIRTTYADLLGETSATPSEPAPSQASTFPQSESVSEPVTVDSSPQAMSTQEPTPQQAA